MTIGPDPMTSTEFRSPRRGIAHSCLHQGAEFLEKTAGVVRARRRLRVVLDAEDGPVEQPEPLDHAVVEVDVADRRTAVGRLERTARPGRDVRPDPLTGALADRAAIARQRDGV